MKPTVRVPPQEANRRDERADRVFRQEVHQALNAEGLRQPKKTIAASSGLSDLWSEEMPTDSTWIVQATVTGQGEGQRGIWQRVAKFSRDSSTATRLSIDTIGTDYESDAALDVSLDASGNGPLLRVNPATYEMTFKAVIKITEVR